MTPVRAQTEAFVLAGWLRQGRGKTLAVYIEGDGNAWLSRFRASSDPTPRNPQALLLAMADPTTGPVLYLARPCQYVEGSDRRGCSVDVWTAARFSETVVRAMDEAIDQVARELGTESLALYGYSGGGALAALLAERRADVRFLGTAAAVLDTGLWTRLMGDAPLSGSLNPADRASATRDIAQLHVIGGADEVVPEAVLDSWISKGQGTKTRKVVLPGVGHAGPFAQQWRALLERSR